MNIKPTILFLCAAAVLSCNVIAQAADAGVVTLTPEEMKWDTGGLAVRGISQAILIGDPAKPGPYTIRLKVPAGYKLAPHTHPDFRQITVLSGTWYTGYGEKWDAKALKALPAGSFYTEPANVPHFVEVRDETIVQVTGMGPGGRHFVNPADEQK